MKIIELEEIKKVIDLRADYNQLLTEVKLSFKEFSDGLYTVPMPMHFHFPAFGSDSHLKGAYRQGSNFFVIKIANGSPLGGEGIILVFNCETGEPIVMLKDKGFLTTLRTALAGMIVAEMLPWKIKNIGIVGSGPLALMLHQLVSNQYPEVTVYGFARNKNKLSPITCLFAESIDALQKQCDVIFTATSAESPIINKKEFKPNSAFIALGSDDEHKRELSLGLFVQSDFIIVDSIYQASKFGDIAHAQRENFIQLPKLNEVGAVLKLERVNRNKIIADFSGIASQDVAMVKFILSRFQQAIFS